MKIATVGQAMEMSGIPSDMMMMMNFWIHCEWSDWWWQTRGMLYLKWNTLHIIKIELNAWEFAYQFE